MRILALVIRVFSVLEHFFHLDLLPAGLAGAGTQTPGVAATKRGLPRIQ